MLGHRASCRRYGPTSSMRGTVAGPACQRRCRCAELCITSIWSTPKNPGNHARALRRVVDNCTTHLTQREVEDDAKE